MKHIVAAISILVLVGCTHPALPLKDRSPSLNFNSFVDDARLIGSAVECVRQYIERNAREDGRLILLTPSGHERTFVVVEVWDALSQHPDGYTIQVDADEVGETFPQVLFFRLKRSGQQFQVVGLEYGGKHLRQTMEAVLPKQSVDGTR